MSATLLQRFEPGLQYEVEDALGVVFLSEGWAEMVASIEPVLVIPLRELCRTAVETATAADIAFDEAIAAAILRRPDQHE